MNHAKRKHGVRDRYAPAPAIVERALVKLLTEHCVDPDAVDDCRRRIANAIRRRAARRAHQQLRARRKVERQARKRARRARRAR